MIKKALSGLYEIVTRNGIVRKGEKVYKQACKVAIKKGEYSSEDMDSFNIHTYLFNDPKLNIKLIYFELGKSNSTTQLTINQGENLVFDGGAPIAGGRLVGYSVHTYIPGEWTSRLETLCKELE